MEEEKIVDMEEFKKEERRRIRKEKAKAAVNTAVKWCSDTFNGAKEFYYDNREFLNLTLIPIGMAIWKFISKSHKDRSERDYRETSIWDAKVGRWVYTRRPLRRSEQLEFDRRRMEGESVSQILASMHLI